jgi:hypothetical protein
LAGTLLNKDLTALQRCDFFCKILDLGGNFTPIYTIGSGRWSKAGSISKENYTTAGLNPKAPLEIYMRRQLEGREWSRSSTG